MFPLSKQALMGGIMGGCQPIGLVSAPMIGGALIDACNWRSCFGINLPLGVVFVASTAYGFHDPMPTADTALPLKE
jgi:MFS family permease